MGLRPTAHGCDVNHVCHVLQLLGYSTGYMFWRKLDRQMVRYGPQVPLNEQLRVMARMVLVKRLDHKSSPVGAFTYGRLLRDKATAPARGFARAGRDYSSGPKDVMIAGGSVIPVDDSKAVEFKRFQSIIEAAACPSSPERVPRRACGGGTHHFI